MCTEWITSSNGLPREGQQIEFVLDSRSVAIEGTYDRQAFHSHWAEYDVDRVRSWRNLTPEFQVAVPPRNRAACVLSSALRHDTSHQLLPAGGLAHAT